MFQVSGQVNCNGIKTFWAYQLMVLAKRLVAQTDLAANISNVKSVGVRMLKRFASTFYRQKQPQQTATISFCERIASRVYGC